jgi:CRISPR-associated protein Csd1
MQKLLETYEACASNPAYADPPQAEEGGREAPALLPVSHTSQQAQIHVVIDGQGNFVRAELLPPKTQFIIPATEDSAGRTSGDAPHPLDDKIHYCAKDYEGGKKNLYEMYVAQLQSWCESPHSHPKAMAVYAYVSKGTLVHDLLACDILYADAAGVLLTEPPAAGKGASKDSIFSRLQAKKVDGVTVRDQGEALVVWSVVMPGDLESRTWKDASLQQAWMAYDAAQMQQKSLCMVQGEVRAVATKHPRNIRRPGDGAKLISSNDKANFTFRGQFLEAEQACTVGYETSHKAHNALRWLLARQGYRNGEQAVVAWAVSGARVPNPCEDFLNMDFEDLLRDEVSPSSDTADVAEQSNEPPLNMGLVFADRLRKALAGYKSDLKDTGGIAIMALDAASPGRISVTFYREQMLEQYLDNLQKWQEDFAWVLPVRMPEENAGKGKQRKRTVYAAYAPVPETIARVAYGRRIDDSLRKATVERLLPCIVDASQLPRDIVECCVRRACNRVALEKWEWPEVLGVACAVYKGYYVRHHKKKEYDMALDEERTSRDYLYGRLLAVAEYIERAALDMTGEKRPTNAARLMQRFADHPYATWRQLELQLSPYIQRLQASSKRGYLIRAQKKLTEVYGKFLTDEYTSSAKLSGEFLLGYHCQLSDFYTKTENSNPAEAEDEKGA